MTCKDKTIIKTDLAPAAIGPYSVGVAGGPFVFTAGQLGIDPKTGSLVEGGVEAETRQALQNLSAILEAANSCMDNVVKTTVFLRDINDFAKMNAIYGEFFTENPPARSAVQVAALPKNGAVEIEAISLTKNN
ncbi:MAG: RidA family protein [Anaerolineaceae bacterium]|nr:RidA family protein [Anaerolineaceae bacterium]